ncbi:hypothetical protein G5B30_01000 [Sphingobacterium sp. SGG-5]|uniref:hypothetical protein n=1 Tax=Sphingobacterium sp. SGG-5 TaxID=2710881 RepID=UPI0013EAF6EB|nr:hypothetical protein [Sphingobacterium sp. SGG-5]NGM60482.1 hypothetical protein [Sphingobacterium sp. SGG-5]
MSSSSMRLWNECRTGTLGGTLCSIWVSFDMGDMLHTALMAAVGTLVSVAVSRLLALKGKDRDDDPP